MWKSLAFSCLAVLAAIQTVEGDSSLGNFTGTCILFNVRASGINSEDPWQLSGTVGTECLGTRGGVRNCCAAIRYAVWRARGRYAKASKEFFLNGSDAEDCYKHFFTSVRSAISDQEPVGSFVSPTSTAMGVCRMASSNFTTPADASSNCSASAAGASLMTVAALPGAARVQGACAVPGAPDSSSCQACRDAVGNLTADIAPSPKSSIGRCGALAEVAAIALSNSSATEDAVASCLALRPPPLSCPIINFNLVNYTALVQTCGAPGVSLTTCCLVVTYASWIQSSYSFATTQADPVVLPDEDSEGCQNAFATTLSGAGVNSSLAGICGFGFPAFSLTAGASCGGLTTASGWASALTNYSGFSSLCQEAHCDPACLGHVTPYVNSLAGANGTDAERGKCARQVALSWLIYIDASNFTKMSYDALCPVALSLQYQLPPNSTAVQLFEQSRAQQATAQGSPSTGGGSSTGLIAGLTVGGVVLLALVLVSGAWAAWWWHHHRWKLDFSPPEPGENASRIPNGSTQLPPLMNSSQASMFGMRIFALSDLKEGTGNFCSRKELGRGSCGRVYVGDLPDVGRVAVKRLTDSQVSDLVSEMQMVQALNHKHLVRLIGCCEEEGEQLLVYELMQGGSLSSHLFGLHSELNLLTWPRRLVIALDTARGIDYLHNHAGSTALVHRDLKPSNILLDQKLHAKLSDFGLSRYLPTSDASHKSTRGIKGTPGYIDPVMWLSMQITTSNDIYSFGVVLLELLNNRPAVDSRHDKSLVSLARDQVKEGKLPVDPTLDTPENHESVAALAELAMRCTSFAVTDRPEIREVVKVLELQQPAAAVAAVGESQQAVEEADLMGDEAYMRLLAASEKYQSKWSLFRRFLKGHRRRSDLSFEARSSAWLNPWPGLSSGTSEPQSSDRSTTATTAEPVPDGSREESIIDHESGSQQFEGP